VSYTPPPSASGGGGYDARPPQANQKAFWSMILGILAIAPCGPFAGIPALVLGRFAKKEIAAADGVQGGEGMATAGVVLGWISVAITITLLIIVVLSGGLTIDA
jgi:hypothetical protein